MFEKMTIIAPNKRLYQAAVVLALVLLVPFSAFGDRLELENGQVFEGEIIDEEDERVQLKLDGSGARLWFSRDQISSLQKSSPSDSDSAQEDQEDVEIAPAAAPEDDEARAQKLLDRLKERPQPAGQETALPEPPVIGAEYAAVTIEVFTDYQ